MENIFLTVNAWMSQGLLLGALGCFLWGGISVLFSPCHLASIPLIVGYVAGQKHPVTGKKAVFYAIAFSSGLFITISLVGLICAILGRMLGDIGPYWAIFAGLLLLWVALDMLGITTSSMSSGIMAKIQVKGLTGALILGLAYGTLSGSCTFGFIAPILAVITLQQKVLTGLILILLFGTGHCIPIAIAGSSSAFVKKLLKNRRWSAASALFRKLAGFCIGILGLYFITRPVLQIFS